jgi:hypothetical protein
LPLLRPSIWIDAALDLRDALLVLQDHRRNGDRAPTMIATIGTSNPPRPMIESTSLTSASAKPTTIDQRQVFWWS